MVRPAHTLITYSGVFGTAASPQEEWSFGLRDSASVADADLGALALAAKNAYATWFTGIMPSNVVLTNTRVARIKGQDSDDVAGRVERRADGSFMQADNSTDVTGGGGAINAPTQLAVVATLVTARPGPTGLGRIFLPMPAFAPATTDRLLSESDAGVIASSVRGLIVDLNGVDGFGSISVISSKGFVSPVTRVRVGRVVDTMRSRRNRRDEGYITSSL